MGAEHLPTVVIDVLDLHVGRFEEGNAILVPRRVVAELTTADGLRVENGRGLRRHPSPTMSMPLIRRRRAQRLSSPLRLGSCFFSTKTRSLPGSVHTIKATNRIAGRPSTSLCAPSERHRPDLPEGPSDRRHVCAKPNCVVSLSVLASKSSLDAS